VAVTPENMAINMANGTVYGSFLCFIGNSTNAERLLAKVAVAVHVTIFLPARNAVLHGADATHQYSNYLLSGQRLGPAPSSELNWDDGRLMHSTGPRPALGPCSSSFLGVDAKDQ
jgi:hypothetical protein